MARQQNTEGWLGLMGRLVCLFFVVYLCSMSVCTVFCLMVRSLVCDNLRLAERLESF